ncbi:hypothetical protein HK099_003333 [Clydaea vesicula]|uniref:Copper transport protein n=1 Tax=Clydaea vesicula TaxID=447962 RepID=A0AAD5U8E5_9FUNG|nr:hypothetical protein HK099_003333 [Clydaea vesicula]KAJ3396011.1 hypothetical protein HDU92_004314 [Lobulomyces angularis]
MSENSHHHSTHMHSNHNIPEKLENSHDHSSDMSMVLNWSLNATIVFKSWTTSSEISLFVSCIIIFLIAYYQEYLKVFVFAEDVKLKNYIENKAVVNLSEVNVVDDREQQEVLLIGTSANNVRGFNKIIESPLFFEQLSNGYKDVIQ